MRGNNREDFSDAYVRLASDRLQPIHSESPQFSDSLVFVDLDIGTQLDSGDIAWLQKQIVQAPPGYFLQASSVLLRWPNSALDEDQEEVVREQAKGISEFLRSRGARPIRVGFVHFPVSAEPRILWSSDDAAENDSDEDDRLLARARAAELKHLLKWGNGIWRPTEYHYCLPSGEHSNTFLRLANAIQRPRDARALATWLSRHITDDLAILTDTSTLTPLVLAMQQQMVAEGFHYGDTVTLADYPSNSFEIEQVIEGVKASPSVLGLVSVTSTGSTI